MNNKDLVKKLQEALNKAGEKLTVDGDLGPKTQATADNYDIEIAAKKKTSEPIPPPSSGERKSPPWYLFALRFKGKKETDPEFNKEMSAKWSLFGMNLGTIAKSWAAWCGLAMAVALSGVGIDYQRNGSLARNWAKYGVEITWRQDGVPQGSIIHINHNADCKSSSSNHVAQANGDCAAEDLLKPGATIDLYGGNQGNTWRVSTFPAAHICAVRWPKDVKDYPKPGPVTKSINCTSKGSNNDSTR
jgi:hypothetical protein